MEELVERKNTTYDSLYGLRNNVKQHIEYFDQITEECERLYVRKLKYPTGRNFSKRRINY